MLHEMVILTMYGHEELRAHEIVHELELLAAAMSRDMDPLVTTVNDICTEFHQIVHGLGDQLLISGNRRCRDDDRIPRHNRDLAVVRCSHA